MHPAHSQLLGMERFSWLVGSAVVRLGRPTKLVAWLGSFFEA
jgi:hypothetical protein